MLETFILLGVRAETKGSRAITVFLLRTPRNRWKCALRVTPMTHTWLPVVVGVSGAQVFSRVPDMLIGPSYINVHVASLRPQKVSS